MEPKVQAMLDESGRLSLVLLTHVERPNYEVVIPQPTLLDYVYDRKITELVNKLM